jgi:hypothetical protein
MFSVSDNVRFSTEDRTAVQFQQNNSVFLSQQISILPADVDALAAAFLFLFPL